MAQMKSATTRQARLAAQEQARVELRAAQEKPQTVEPPKREKREKPPKDAPAD